MKRLMIGFLGLAVAGAIALAQSAPVNAPADQRIDSIRDGRNNNDQIRTLRVQGNGTVGGTLTVTGATTVTGAETVSGTLTVSGAGGVLLGTNTVLVGSSAASRAALVVSTVTSNLPLGSMVLDNRGVAYLRVAGTGATTDWYRVTATNIE